MDPQSPELQAAWAELAPSLRRAEALAAKARKLERTAPPSARNLYRQALDIAADLPDALAGLARTPPDPPTAMDAQVLGDRIRLIWTPPPPDGLGPLTFAVLRKRNGVLEHPGDGTRIAEVGTCEFDDMLVTPGETVGYAVLSRRGGVDSVGAISLGPFVFLADVKDVNVELGEREAELTWSPPRGIAEVRVIRKRGGPPTQPEGWRPARLGLGSRDRPRQRPRSRRSLRDLCRLPDARRPACSPRPGSSCPRDRSRSSRRSWPRKLHGSCKSRRAGSGSTGSSRSAAPSGSSALRIPFPWRPVRVSPASRSSLSEDRGSNRPRRIAPTTPIRPASGLCHYTPILAWAEAWIIGHGAVLTRVPDPTDLRATRAGSGLGSTPGGGVRVTLRWRWPAEATAALIVARQGAPPQGPSDPLATTTNVSRTDYERQDCWTLQPADAHPADPDR